MRSNCVVGCRQEIPLFSLIPFACLSWEVLNVKGVKRKEIVCTARGDALGKA